MAEAIPSDWIWYRPPDRVRRWYAVKKSLAYVVYAGTAGFVVWLGWPGLTSPPNLSVDYLIFVAGMSTAAVALGLLVVITWNERLFRIEEGRMTWPFPYLRKNGRRTRYVALDDIAEARDVAGAGGRRGLELVLRDGTQMFLPLAQIGAEGAYLFEDVVRYVNRARDKGPGERADLQAR